MTNRLTMLGLLAGTLAWAGAASAQADPSAICAEAIAKRENIAVSGVVADKVEAAGAGSVVMLNASNGESFTCHVDGTGAITELEEEGDD